MQLTKEYGDERDRYRFMLQEFGRELSRSEQVIDFGCRANRLKRKLDVEVIGVDKEPDRCLDLIMDLEDPESIRKIGGLTEGRKTSAVMSHVLEHLRNPKEILEAVSRYVEDYLLIVLPNEKAWIHRYLFTFKHRGDTWKFKPEPPHHKHKWQFEIDTARRFCRETLSDNFVLKQERLPSQKLANGRIHTKTAKFFIDRVAPDSLRARDWWGLFKNRRADIKDG